LQIRPIIPVPINYGVLQRCSLEALKQDIDYRSGKGKSADLERIQVWKEYRSGTDTDLERLQYRHHDVVT
jgi:hypothetical protein